MTNINENLNSSSQADTPKTNKKSFTSEQKKFMTEKFVLMGNKVNIFSTWATTNLIYDLGTSSPFAEIYDNYRKYALAQETIPLTKKNFGREFRKILKTPIELNKVNWVNRNGIQIDGIYIS